MPTAPGPRAGQVVQGRERRAVLEPGAVSTTSGAPQAHRCATPWRPRGGRPSCVATAATSAASHAQRDAAGGRRRRRADGACLAAASLGVGRRHRAPQPGENHAAGAAGGALTVDGAGASLRTEDDVAHLARAARSAARPGLRLDVGGVRPARLLRLQRGDAVLPARWSARAAPRGRPAARSTRASARPRTARAPRGRATQHGGAPGQRRAPGRAPRRSSRRRACAPGLPPATPWYRGNARRDRRSARRRRAPPRCAAAGCTSRRARSAPGRPVLIWPQSVATARSAMVVSSVSPERWRHHQRCSRCGAPARRRRASRSACRSGSP